MNKIKGNSKNLENEFKKNVNRSKNVKNKRSEMNKCQCEMRRKEGMKMKDK